MSHQCDAIGCRTTTAPDKFMCTRHWYMVPKEMRDTIYERYRACGPNFGFLSDRLYLEACIGAIEHLARLEKRDVAPGSYHRLLRAIEAKETRDV